MIHILLIEDNEGDILLTKEALDSGRIANTMAVVKNGWDAIQYLERASNNDGAEMPDLILLDVNLPKMNGHEVLINIKSNEKVQHIPVIMLTTSSSAPDIFKAYKQHVNCYITKPVAADGFLEIVASIETFWLAVVKLPVQSA